MGKTDTTAQSTPIPVWPLYQMLDEAVAGFGDRPCIDFLGKRYTYAEIGDLVARAALGFQHLGVKKGVNVGLCLPNTPYFVICYFAVLRAGGTVVNYNPLYVERELKYQIEDSDTSIMVTLDLKQIYPKVAAMLEETSSLQRVVVCRMVDILPSGYNVLYSALKRSELAVIPDDLRHVAFAKLIANDGNAKQVAIDPSTDIAVLQYTGGTTGVPKGAMLTHANLTANARQCVLWFSEARPGEERMLAVLPFFHVFAMTVALNAAMLLGAEILLVPRFDLDDLLELIGRKKPTLFPAVPTIYTAINAHPERAAHDLTSIRFCISGGAPLPQEVKQQFEAGTGCVVIEGYGLSECSPVACITPISGQYKPGTVGLPVPGTVVEIVSLTDDTVVLPPGERGEICIRGPQLMKGYWNRPEDTERTLKGGRLHTGDIGIMDEDGYTAIVDRIKDLIIAGGFNVYPRTVEEAIYLHPSIEEVVVAGVPDAYRGQTVKAYVKLAAGASLGEAELRTFLKDKLSPIEMPKKIEFRDSLPRTLIGKLSRKDLLDEEKRKAAGEES